MELSVVMAVRNGERHVAQAIESILAQSFGDFEYLIVDDASADTTPEILSTYARQDPRIKVLRHEQQIGGHASANVGLAEARGKTIARQDADDISPPDRFAIQREVLDSPDRDVVLVTGFIEVFDDDDRPESQPVIGTPPTWQPRLEWDLLFGNPVGAGGHVMFPRIVGGRPVRFPTTHLYAEDYELWCLLCRQGRIVCPTEIVYRYRRHGAQVSTARWTEQQRCLALIRHQHQMNYLPAGTSFEAADALTRFWMREPGDAIADKLPEIGALLSDLRSRFLSDIEKRHGPAERTAIERVLEDALDERLAFWLYRAIRAWKPRTVSALLPLMAGRSIASIASTAARLATTGLRRRLLGGGGGGSGARRVSQRSNGDNGDAQRKI
jgi:hypothetical protein